MVTSAGGNAGVTAHDLFRVQLDWNEGRGTGNQGEAAEAGEVTWDAAGHGQVQWTVPGGSAGTDHAAAASATAPLGRAGEQVFGSTAGLVSDVQGWLDAPASNFGWVLIAQDEGTASSTRRIASREDAASAPLLEIEFTPLRVASVAIDGDELRLGWDGGVPPFVVETTRDFAGPDWGTIGSTSGQSFVGTAPEAPAFFRVATAPASDTARYTVTWTATWSGETFPTNFPGGAHFSGLIGGTHSDAVAFWAPGSLASPGI